MKKLNIFIILMIMAHSGFSQSAAADPEEKVEQYCDVVATDRFLSNKVTINIDFGEERSVWKDNRLKDRKGNLVKFNTVVDALNHLGKDGWKLVNAFPVGGGAANTPSTYHYIFKREFSRREAD